MNSFTRLGVALLCAMAFAAHADINVGKSFGRAKLFQLPLLQARHAFRV